MKIQILASIIVFSIITTSMVQASTKDSITEISSNVSVKITYENMTTAQLQVAVENHSMTGTLSFVAGKELMKRWSAGNTSVEISYTDMTTAQLQVAVEKHSMTGKLSFAAGKELMKRWSNS